MMQSTFQRILGLQWGWQSVFVGMWQQSWSSQGCCWLLNARASWTLLLSAGRRLYCNTWPLVSGNFVARKLPAARAPAANRMGKALVMPTNDWKMLIPSTAASLQRAFRKPNAVVLETRREGHTDKHAHTVRRVFNSIYHSLLHIWPIKAIFTIIKVKKTKIFFPLSHTQLDFYMNPTRTWHEELLEEDWPTPILLITFTDIISKWSQADEGFQSCGPRIISPIPAYEVVYPASSGGGLQHAVAQFVAKCEAAWRRTGTSKSTTRTQGRGWMLKENILLKTLNKCGFGLIWWSEKHLKCIFFYYVWFAFRFIKNMPIQYF